MTSRLALQKPKKFVSDKNTFEAHNLTGKQQGISVCASKIPSVQIDTELTTVIGSQKSASLLIPQPLLYFDVGWVTITSSSFRLINIVILATLQLLKWNSQDDSEFTLSQACRRGRS